MAGTPAVAAGRWGGRLLVAGWLAPQILLGFLAARLDLAARHTLANDGHWVSTKTTVARELLGARSFVEGRQPLARGVLNLSAWHGFQEILSRDTVDATSIEFDFLLVSGAYLVAVFNQHPSGFSGIRLSQGRGTPGFFFTAAADGEFLRREPILVERRGALRPLRIPAREWHHAEIGLAADRVELRLDGNPIAGFADEILPGRRVGFRAGWNKAFIDNVAIRRGDEVLWNDAFDAPTGAGRRIALAIAGVVAGNFLLWTVISRRARRPRLELAFGFVMVNGTAAAMAALLWGYVLWTVDRYPPESDVLMRRDTEWLEGPAADLRASLAASVAPRPAAGTERILVIGSSQTWGAGVANDDDAFPAVLERLLNRDAGADRRFECINLGIPATTAPALAGLYEAEWLDLAPRMAIVNLSNNDRDTEAFERAMARMIELSLERGIRVLLVQEANSPERADRSLLARHAALDRLAAKHGVPVVDMHSYLRTREGDGFLWWDKVHLTSFGHRLVAARLLAEVTKIIDGRPEPAEAGPAVGDAEARTSRTGEPY